MTLLTDTSIREILIGDKERWMQDSSTKQEKLLIAPFYEQALTPVGYDLRVGERFLKMSTKLRRPQAKSNRLKKNGEITIKHNEVVAIETEEFIGMPQNRKYSGILVSKVSIAERGISHISTSLDPDYKGRMIITLTNHSKRKATLKREQPFCTVVFFKNEKPASKVCEKDPNKHINFLLEEWSLPPKLIGRKLLFNIIKVLGLLIPLLYLLHRYLSVGVNEAEAVLFVAISSALYMILSTALKSDE